MHVVGVLLPEFHMLMKTIVTPDSAVIGLPNERSVYLNGDHLSICKFSSRSTESRDAAALVRELGRLPLAIEQAEGFMPGTSVSISGYRRLYNGNSLEVLNESPSLTHRRKHYREAVRTTSNVSFNAIRERDHLASVILQTAPFLDGKKIQKDLFYNANWASMKNDEILSEIEG